jgi:hypothetical protein
LFFLEPRACDSNFTVKVKNAQNAGAAIAIVINNIPGPPAGMGGADPTIVIMVSWTTAPFQGQPAVRRDPRRRDRRRA